MTMKTSSYQLFWMVSISSIIVYSYLPIKLAAEQSRQDCWISLLIGSMIMLAITWIVLKVCMKHQDKTFVGFVNELLGTVLGKIIAFIYLSHWFMQMVLFAKGTSDFQNLVMLHNTPMFVILMFLLFLVTYAVYKGGLTTIGRCAEIIGPIFLLTVFVQLFLNPHEMNFHRMLPIYADSGWFSILKGTFYSVYYLIDPSIIFMLFFFSQDKRAASRSILLGTALSMIWGLLATIALLFVTGPNMAAILVVPIYSITKFVSILNFVQNIDAVFIPLWLLGVFIKLSICLFIMSYGLSEWTGFKRWKLLACLISIALFVFVIYSGYELRIANALKNLFVLGIYYPFVYLVVPLLLWMVSVIRSWRKKSVANP